MNKKYWTITDRKEIKTSEYLEELKKLLDDNVYSYYSNDELDSLCPAPKETEYVKFEASIEPDKEYLGKSYNDVINKDNKKFMTLRQGIILNLEVYKITGERIDIIGVTITSTLDRDGHAMGMCRDTYGRFFVDSYYRVSRYSDYGLRQQFPLFPSLPLPLETIEIGGIKYSKQEVEEKLRGIKAIN